MKLPEKLETERLIVRKFKESDRTRFIDFMTDAEATKYLMFSEEQKTEEGANQLFDYIIRAYNSNEPIFSLAIESKEFGYAGSCGISKIEDQVWECYYSLNRAFWGKGLATEAMQALLDYCFEELEIEELRAYMSPANPNSAKVAEKLGMTHQGIQKHPIFGKEGKLYLINNDI